MYQSIIDFLQNPKSTAENVIRKFKMDKVIFFVAHFLGIGIIYLHIKIYLSLILLIIYCFSFQSYCHQRVRFVLLQS